MRADATSPEALVRVEVPWSIDDLADAFYRTYPGRDPHFWRNLFQIPINLRIFVMNREGEPYLLCFDEPVPHIIERTDLDSVDMFIPPPPSSRALIFGICKRHWREHGFSLEQAERREKHILENKVIVSVKPRERP